MKYLKIFESHSLDSEIEDFLANEYLDSTYKFDKSDSPFNNTIHVSVVNYKDYDISFRKIGNKFVVYYYTKSSSQNIDIDHNDNDNEVNVYDKFKPLNPWERVYDFHKDELFTHLFYGDFTERDKKEFGKTLRNNKGEDYVLLYHGTTCNNTIESEGLKRTKESTKKSLQSQVGYVYLSVYPDMAKTFGKMAYPNEDICVYQVFIKIKDLKPDNDQLYNKRLWGGVKFSHIKNNLVDSLLYGHGARVKRDILPYEIKKYDI